MFFLYFWVTNFYSCIIFRNNGAYLITISPSFSDNSEYCDAEYPFRKQGILFCLFIYSTACHKLFFRGWEKAATYGRIGNLWQAAATYDLPTMISENWIHFGWFSRLFGAKNRFHAFLWHKMERKANRRLKLSEKQWICMTKRDHSGFSHWNCGRNSTKEAKAGENDEFFFAKNWIIL